MDTSQTIGLLFTGLAALGTVVLAVLGVVQWIMSSKSSKKQTDVDPSPVREASPMIVNNFSPKVTVSQTGATYQTQHTSAKVATQDVPRLAPTPARSTPATKSTTVSISTPRTEDDNRREMVKNALAATSELIVFAHEFAEEYTRNSRSLSPFSRQMTALKAIRLAFAERSRTNPDNMDIIKTLTTLDAALNKLDLVWTGSDPRNTLMTYMDPFASTSKQRTMEDMIAIFTGEARRIALTISSAGYPVMQRTDYGASYATYFLGTGATNSVTKAHSNKSTAQDEP